MPNALRALAGVSLSAALLTAPTSTAHAARVTDAHHCVANVHAETAADERTELRRIVLCLINDRRSDAGLPALKVDEQVQRAAQRHSRDMVKRRYFSHVSPNGGTAGQRLASASAIDRGQSVAFAENIAWGSGPHATPTRIVAAWMRSPGHRANILSRTYRHTGIGIADGAPRRGVRDALTYTQNFTSR